jgi:tetratricopeptide (TPR) repeat protein
MLGELTAAHLLTEHAPGRYALHDLLRAYAAELAEATDAESARRAALQRALDCYLHTAHAAALVLNPTRDPIALGPPCPGTAPEHLQDPAQALAWFQAEHKVLLAVITRAGEAGFDAHAWRLPFALTNFFDWQGHWPDWAATQRSALAAAQRLGDQVGQAHAHHHLGYAYARLGAHADARQHLSQALGLYQRLGYLVGQARIHHILCMGHNQQGRPQEALADGLQALRLYQRADHERGQAGAINAVGWSQPKLGNNHEAITFSLQALTMHRELGNQHGEATTLDTLGYARHHLSDYARAISCYQQAGCGPQRNRAAPPRRHVCLLRDRRGVTAAAAVWTLGGTPDVRGTARRAPPDQVHARQAQHRGVAGVEQLAPGADQAPVRLGARHPCLDGGRAQPQRVTGTQRRGPA